MKNIYRIAIIGYTGRGGYGHELDMAFDGVEGARVIAISDPDDLGRHQTLEKTGAEKGYNNYLQLLEVEKPDITVVASREIGGGSPRHSSSRRRGRLSHLPGKTGSSLPLGS